MKYPVEHKAQTRGRILEEAAKAIRREGIERMSIAAVMASAGLTVGGFYAHFKSKQDLVAETVNFMFEARYAAFFGSGTAQPRETLSRMIDVYLSMRHRNNTIGGCPLPVLVGQMPFLPSAAKDRLALGLERLTCTVSLLLRAMDAEDPPGTARYVIAEMMGAISMARVTVGDDNAEALLAAARLSVRQRLGLDS